MNELRIAKEKWQHLRAATNGLLGQAEKPVQRIILSTDYVSLIGQDGVEVARIDLTSNFSHPAWVQTKQGSVSVHIDLEAADVH